MVYRSHIEPVSPFSRKMDAGESAVQGAFHCSRYADKSSYNSSYSFSGASRKKDGAARVIQRRRMLTLLSQGRAKNAKEGSPGFLRNRFLWNII